MAAILLDRVEFSYREGAAAVRCLSLEVGAGSLTGLLGPNGAGKSTLIKLMGGILRPGRGTVEVLGRDMTLWNRRQLARRVAVVQASPSLFFPFTVEETVAMGRWSRTGSLGWLGARDREAVARAMERTDVSALASRRMEELSAGERQRVYLARALAQEGEMLLLDEPVAHLDVRHQLEILELLADIHCREGHTVVLTVHDLDLAARFCREIVVLREGALVARGAAAKVLTPVLLREVFGVEALADVNPLTGTPRLTLALPGAGASFGEAGMGGADKSERRYA